MASFGYSMTYLALNHDIKKFERWKRQAIEFTLEAQGIVSDISLPSTRENGRNTVILSVTYLKKNAKLAVLTASLIMHG